MFGTFNMGLGMIFAVDKSQADAAVAEARRQGGDAFIAGEVVSGEKGVDIL